MAKQTQEYFKDMLKDLFTMKYPDTTPEEGEKLRLLREKIEAGHKEGTPYRYSIEDNMLEALTGKNVFQEVMERMAPFVEKNSSETTPWTDAINEKDKVSFQEPTPFSATTDLKEERKDARFADPYFSTMPSHGYMEPKTPLKRTVAGPIWEVPEEYLKDDSLFDTSDLPQPQEKTTPSFQIPTDTFLEGPLEGSTTYHPNWTYAEFQHSLQYTKGKGKTNYTIQTNEALADIIVSTFAKAEYYWEQEVPELNPFGVDKDGYSATLKGISMPGLRNLTTVQLAKDAGPFLDASSDTVKKMDLSDDYKVFSYNTVMWGYWWPSNFVQNFTDIFSVQNAKKIGIALLSNKNIPTAILDTFRQEGICRMTVYIHKKTGKSVGFTVEEFTTQFEEKNGKWGTYRDWRSMPDMSRAMISPGLPQCVEKYYIHLNNTINTMQVGTSVIRGGLK